MFILTCISTLKMLARLLMNIGTQDIGIRWQTQPLSHPWWWSTAPIFLFMNQPSLLMVVLSYHIVDSYVVGPLLPVPGHFVLLSVAMMWDGLSKNSRQLLFHKVNYSSCLGLGKLPTTHCPVQNPSLVCSCLLCYVGWLLPKTH